MHEDSRTTSSPSNATTTAVATTTVPTPASATAERHAAGLARAFAYIDAHLGERLDAAMLSRHAAMSCHHFHRVFAARCGCSVGDYVAARRLRRACALLLSGPEPVLEIALAVGYESAQALAKAMRRELDATPTEIRSGNSRAWARLLDVAAPAPLRKREGVPMLEPIRYATLPSGHVALTATARGMVDRSLKRAARTAFGELYPAIVGASLMPRARTWLAFSPDDPTGPDDPDCRYVAGVIFDAAIGEAPRGGSRPTLDLTGTLAWWEIEPGRAAVFLHRGPYEELHVTWRAIYRDWEPASGETLRDAPPFEVMLNSPETTAREELLTEIWVPVGNEK